MLAASIGYTSISYMTSSLSTWVRQTKYLFSFVSVSIKGYPITHMGGNTLAPCIIFFVTVINSFGSAVRLRFPSSLLWNIPVEKMLGLWIWQLSYRSLNKLFSGLFRRRSELKSIPLPPFSPNPCIIRPALFGSRHRSRPACRLCRLRLRWRVCRACGVWRGRHSPSFRSSCWSRNGYGDSSVLVWIRGAGFDKGFHICFYFRDIFRSVPLFPYERAVLWIYQFQSVSYWNLISSVFPLRFVYSRRLIACLDV